MDKSLSLLNQSNLSSSGTETYIIKQQQYKDYNLCRLLKPYLTKSSVTYINCLSVEDDKYYIFDQQRNIIRNAHKKFFLTEIKRLKAKIIASKGLTIAIVHRIIDSDGIAKLVADEQSLFSFFSDVKNVCNVVSDLSTLQKKMCSFVSSNFKELMALLLDVISMIVKITNPDAIKLSSVTTYLLDLISMCVRVSALKDKLTVVKEQSFDINLETIAWVLAGVGLPTVLANRIKDFTALTGKRVFDSTGITNSIFDVLDIFMCVLKWLSENVDPLNVLKYLYAILDKKLSFVSNYRLMKSVNELHFKWAKNSQVMLEPGYRAQVIKVQEEILASKSFNDFIMDDKRRMNKAVYDAFSKNIFKFVKSYDSAVRLEPACVIFEGPPGCGKSVLLGNLTKVLSCNKVNMSIYSHIIPDINAAKDFYDDYEGQDVLVVDDIGQQGVSQWRSIINMVSNIKMGLDCAAADKKNTKFFTSRLILGTTNNCSSIQGLSKNDGISDINALFRRIHNVRCKRILTNGVYMYEMEYFKFDESTNMWSNSFLPKWDKHARIMGLPTKISSTDPKDVSCWALSIIKLAMKVNEDTLADTLISDDDVSDLADFYCKEQMMNEEDIFCADDVLKAEEKVFEQHNTNWRVMCMEFYEYIKEFFKGVTASLVSAVTSMVSKISNFANKDDKFEWKVLFDKGTDEVVFEAPNEQCIGCEGKLIGLVTVLMSVAFFTGLSAIVYKPLKRFFSGNNAKKAFAKLSKEPVFVQNQDEENRHAAVNAAPNSVRFMQMRRKIEGETNLSLGHCIVSGNRILTNAHYFGEDMTISLSRNWDTVQRDIFEFENVPVKVIKIDLQYDWMVLEMPNVVFRYPIAKALFRADATFNKQAKSSVYFVNPMKSVLVSDNNLNREMTGTMAIKSKYKQFEKEVQLEKVLIYGITSEGLCGCPVVNGQGQLIGMHCAGTSEFGVAMIYSSYDLEQITKYMRLDNCQGVSREIRKDLNDGQAGLRLDATGLKSSMGLRSTSLIPTGVEMDEFEYELQENGVKLPPVFVDDNGKSKLKDIAMKSFIRTAENIEHADLEFVEQVILSLLPESFDDLTMDETAFGNERIAPLNKDSVNGYGYASQNKKDYFDFEKHEIKSEFLSIFNEFVKQCEEGNVDIDMLLAKEAFKDELRPEEKVLKPRSFRVMPLHHIFATKMCLAKMMNHIVDNKWSNGICIGMNPYTDFDKLYNTLAPLKCFDGDFGNWDGGCNPLIQDLVNKCVRSRYSGKHGKVLDIILESVVRTPVLVKEELYVTTHSMPSGAWITALFNSLINRALTALLYSSQCRKFKRPLSVVEFLGIKDFVLGDDKIVGVSRRLMPFVNAFTMRELAELLRMRYTDGTKGEIDRPFKPVNECVFLKRSFRYHTQLKKFVGALSMQTILNTVLWSDGRKDINEVMTGKGTVVQFECYLHERNDFVKHLFEEYDRLGYSYQKFTPSQISKSMIEDKNLYQYFCEITDKNFNY